MSLGCMEKNTAANRLASWIGGETFWSWGSFVLVGEGWNIASLDRKKNLLRYVTFCVCRELEALGILHGMGWARRGTAIAFQWEMVNCPLQGGPEACRRL